MTNNQDSSKPLASWHPLWHEASKLPSWQNAYFFRFTLCWSLYNPAHSHVFFYSGRGRGPENRPKCQSHGTIHTPVPHDWTTLCCHENPVTQLEGDVELLEHPYIHQLNGGEHLTKRFHLCASCASEFTFDSNNCACSTGIEICCATTICPVLRKKSLWNQKPSILCAPSLPRFFWEWSRL